MRFYLLGILWILGLSLQSQYTETINSKRPGFSESPFAVGKRVYQLETGFFYEKSNQETLFALQDSKGWDVFVRAGLVSEKFEMNVNFKLQKDDFLTTLLPKQTSSISGISRFTVGAKYLFYMPSYKDPDKEIRSWKAKTRFDYNRLIPSIGFYAGLNTDVLGKDYKLGQMSPKAALLLQNDFNDYTVWVNNVYADYITLESMREYGYISTLSLSMSERFSIFLEHQGVFKPTKNEFSIGTGLAYLLKQDLQIDLNAQVPLVKDYFDLYGSLGMSWRLDRHRDYEPKKVQFKDDGSGKLQSKKKYKKKGLFKRR